MVLKITTKPSDCPKNLLFLRAREENICLYFQNEFLEAEHCQKSKLLILETLIKVL